MMNWDEIVALVKSLICSVPELWNIIWRDITNDMRDWCKYSIGLFITTIFYIICLVVIPFFLAILIPTILLESFFIKLGGIKDKMFGSIKLLFYKK